MISDGVDKETFFKGVEVIKILDLGEMLDLVVVRKEPVVDEGFLHFVDKEGSNYTLEVSVVFEVNKEVDFMGAEVRVLLILFLLCQ